MADIIDQAQDLIEKQDEARMLGRRRQSLQPTGQCYNCEEPLPETRLFCGPECRDDFDHRQRISARR